MNMNKTGDKYAIFFFIFEEAESFFHITGH